MFYQAGGKARDAHGKVFQRRLWWPIFFAAILDSLWRTLWGKGTMGFPSTMTFTGRSMNSHSPVNQKISMMFLDADNPNRLIWGTELDSVSARNIALTLLTLAEETDPTGVDLNEYCNALNQSRQT